MSPLNRLLIATICFACTFDTFAKPTISVPDAADNPMRAFAINHLVDSLAQTGHQVAEAGDRSIHFEFFKEGMGPQSFRIQREGNRGWRIFGGDNLGLRYGGLELTKMIHLGGGVDAIQEKVRYIDWWGLYEDVMEEVETVKNEG